MSNTPVSNIVFMGTPQFSVPTLEALVNDARYNVVAVVTQPDKPSGRGQKLTPSPVKVFAKEHEIPVFQPKSIKSITREDAPAETGTKLIAATPSQQRLVEHLNKLYNLTAIIVVAYGKLVPRSIIDCACFGVINVHASLLPRWRGAAPIQYAIFSGDEKSGVSIMQIDEGLDTGPVFSMSEVILDKSETTGSLHDKLSHLGAQALASCLPSILDGSLVAKPQPSSGVKHAAKWEKDDIKIKWKESGELISRRVRACAPFPGARTTLAGESVKIYEVEIDNSLDLSGKEAGSVVFCQPGELLVAAGDGSAISIKKIQFPGKRAMTTEDALRGRKIEVGEKFS